MPDRLSYIQAAKARAEKLAMLTAYDYPCARLLAQSGLDLLLVGDSVGMVVLGYPDTTSVTMDEMVHHTRAVARGARDGGDGPLILADLPFGAAETPALALQNSKRLMEAGAHAVKIEGGRSHAAHYAALREAGIAVMAHIGMQPQRVRIEGGYKIKGRTPEQADALLADACAAEQCGAFAVLLELVVPTVAASITGTLKIPTIGIGSGPDCDGQVLVLHDVIGLFPWFKPKFATQRANVAGEIERAAKEFVNAIKAPAES